MHTLILTKCLSVVVHTENVMAGERGGRIDTFPAVLLTFRTC